MPSPEHRMVVRTIDRLDAGGERGRLPAKPPVRLAADGPRRLEHRQAIVTSNHRAQTSNRHKQSSQAIRQQSSQGH